jgi:hypothetical protein
MMILAIDPGTEQSGFCWYEGGRIVSSGVCENEEMLIKVGMFAYNANEEDNIAIEMIASYGMAVGKEVFRTVWWTGRFAERWSSSGFGLPIEVYRKDVKMHLCGTPRAKDANIRQALIDLLGPQGTKKDPGPTYGVKSHAWAALGVAVTAAHEKGALIAIGARKVK